MKFDTKEIARGEHNEKIVWICDLRYNDYRKKPIRHVKPTKVLIRSNKESDKTFYYCDSHFVELNKNDQPKKKTHSLYDNTGFRSYKGVPVNCFETEAECIEYYKKLCQEVVDGYELFKKSFFTHITHIDQKMEEYKKIINYYD